MELTSSYNLLPTTSLPQLLSRIDEQIMFLPLSKEEIKQIMKLLLRKVDKMLAQQGALIAQSRLAGTLSEDDDLFDFFVQQLKDLTPNFARSVAPMTLLTIEQAWNALVGVVWGTVNKALSAGRLAGLPLPTLTLGAG